MNMNQADSASRRQQGFLWRLKSTWARARKPAMAYAIEFIKTAVVFGLVWAVWMLR